MRFAYKGYDRGGKAVADTVEASDRASAGENLLQRGVFVTELKDLGGSSSRRAGGPEHVAVFFRQLSVLVGSGTPLVDALHALERQTPEGPWRGVISAMRQRIEEGAQLSEAMAAHGKCFDGVCQSLIAAGESGGRLDAMLQRLALLTRQQVRIRKTVRGALAYPSLLIAIALIVTCTMIGFVLPRFEGLFQSLDAPLPPTTRFLMDVSQFARARWYVLVGGAVLLGGGGWAWWSSEGGRALWQRGVLRVPQVGPLLRNYATARIARVLGVLLEGKVGMLEALRLTRQSVASPAYAALVTRAEEAVTRGENISGALGDPSLISPAVCEAIRSGERSGQVGPVLMSVADHLDEDNELALKTVTGLLEPVILIVMGVVVGVMAVSMFLPLFDLAGAGGGPH